MNKILRYSFVALLAMIGWSNANAEAKEVVIDFNAMDIVTSHSANAEQGIEASDAGDITSTWSTTVDGVTISVSPKAEDATNPNRFWQTNNGPQLRCYSGTITIQASEAMTGIAFTSKSSKFNLTTTVGSIDNKKWSGEATEVPFTVAGNTQLDKIVVTIGGSTTPDPQPTESITVAKALEIINGLADGAKTDDEYTVTGYVLQVTEKPGNYKNISFIIADNATDTEGLTVFRANKFNDADITNPDLLQAGDLVVVRGLLQKYVKNNVVTPEIAQGGVILSINGKTTDEAPNPEDAITKGKDANSPMTVEEALNYINGFSNGFTTSNQYYVKGSVSEVTEISTANGNATFKMGNLVAFRLKGLENHDIKDENYLKANDEVVVLAKLQKYVKNEEVTPELSGGYIYELNGKTKDEGGDPNPGTITGDGSQTNPYTVGDLKIMTEEQYPAEAVWVKGVIIGSASSKSALHAGTEEDADVASNIAIAESASETTFAPIALAANTDIRAKLNVLDNPGNKGKDVLLKGKIQKYFSTTGVKDLVQAIFEGETISGITNITADQLKNAPAYNVAGQRVNEGYKGLVIKGGKKMIVK